MNIEELNNSNGNDMERVLRQAESNLSNMQNQQPNVGPSGKGGPAQQRPVSATPPRPPRNPGQSGAQPTNMRQTSDYNPTSGGRQNTTPTRPAPSGGARPMARGGQGNNQQGQSQRSGGNSGQQRPQQRSTPAHRSSGNSGNSSGTGLNNKHIIMIVIGAIVLLIVGFVVFSMVGKSKKGDNEEEQTTEEYTEVYTEEYAVEPTSFYIPYVYTDEEVKALRAAGYTGDEIEAYQYIEKPAEELLDEAAKEQEAYVEAFIKPLYDETSDKYKANLKNTWLGLPERNDVGDFADYLFVNSETRNLDFEKVPIYGNQIFLKVYLDDDAHESYFFMQCDPARYMELGSSGNIVVNYKFIHPKYIDENGIEQEDTSRMFIVDASEVTVTDTTGGY